MCGDESQALPHDLTTNYPNPPLPASAVGPPRGFGGGGICRRDQQEEFKMAKSKSTRKAKSATTTKKSRKAAERSKAISTKRANSKQADVIDMLRQPQG